MNGNGTNGANGPTPDSSLRPPLVHFVDFDQPAEFEALEQWSGRLSARNFVLDFDNASARCAHDIDATGMGEVLEKRAAEAASIRKASISARRASLSAATIINVPSSPPLVPTSIPPERINTPPPPPRKLGTRWINIWRPEEQKELLQRVGRHYGFSARLVASMCCAHKAVNEPPEAARHEHRSVAELMNEFMQPWRSHNGSNGSNGRKKRNGRRTSPTAARKQAAATTRQISREDDDDGEGTSTNVSQRGGGGDDGMSVRTGLSGGDDSIFGAMDNGNGSGSSNSDGTGVNGLMDLDHYRLVDDVWHFSSVDWGQRYLCIGFNSLYRVDREIDVDSYKPAGKRVWTWLVLCDDGAVVAIHENPFPGLDSNRLTRHQRRVVLAIRRNLRNVFKQLSRGFNDTTLRNVLEVVKLRSGLSAGQHGGGSNSNGNGSSNGGSNGNNGSSNNGNGNGGNGAPDVAEEDAPSLLFYYLFDDWFTSYSLVARREHQYGVELDLLRDRMFHRAELEHVSRLHHYGRQLAVLKRIYTSYSTIIQRILDGPQAHAQTVHAAGSAAVAAAGGGFAVPPSGPVAIGGGGEEDLVERSTVIEVGEASAYGVEIAVAASTRFRRLRDRINMYAIGEIQDCIEEKNSLMELNFNLITLKESSYIEGLTRITILLAKVTIMFIPISFITAYFTVEFTGADDQPVKYNVQQYWATFAVVFFITFCGLGLFGRLSGTQEGKPIYESFTSVFIKGWRSLWRKRDADSELEQPGDINLGALKRQR